MQPNRALLVRKQDKEIEKILNLMGRMLDEIVNFGTHVLNMCEEQTKFSEFQSPIPSTFVHFLSLLDGASIIVKKGNSDALKPLLRGLLESGLTVEYMIKEDEKKGTIAYLVSEAKNRIKIWRKFEQTTPQGKEFKEILAKQGIPIPDVNVEEKIQNLEGLLDRTPYNEVNEEWKRVKKQNNGKDPNWHSLFGGPFNVRGLAVMLDKEAYYEIFYKNLSTFIHASGTSQRVRKTEDSKSVMAGLRTLDELPTLVTITASLALDIYIKMLDNFNSEKKIEYAQWYVKEISTDFLAVTKAKINTHYLLDERYRE